MDRCPTLVHRPGRDDGQVVGRLQRAAGRRPPPACAQGRDLDVLDRRPLRRRHPQHGWLPAQRECELVVRHVPAERPATRSAAGRRRLGDHVAPAAGRGTALDHRLAEPPAPRRVLETWLGVRGLWRHRVPSLSDRRLGGWLFQPGAATHGGPHLPAEGADRTVGASVPAPGPSWAEDGLHDRGPALVGPLAQGHRHRRHGRARLPGVDERQRTAADLLRHAQRQVDRGAGLAFEPYRRGGTVPGHRWPARRRGFIGAAVRAGAGDLRQLHAVLVEHGRPRSGIAARPAGRRRLGPDVHRPGVGRAAGDLRPAADGAGLRGRPADRLRQRTPVRRAGRRRLDHGELRPPEPDP